MDLFKYEISIFYLNQYFFKMNLILFDMIAVNLFNLNAWKNFNQSPHMVNIKLTCTKTSADTERLEKHKISFDFLLQT